MKKIRIQNEVGVLRKVLIHSPNKGLGEITPSKAQDWLFEDIIHLDTIRRQEYDYYVKLLMYFLDEKKILGKLASVDAEAHNRAFYKPSHEEFHNSENIIEIQSLLSSILENNSVRLQLVAAVCATEGKSIKTQNELSALDAVELASCLISGCMPNGRIIFPPLANLIFTRDIGVVINNHILLMRAAKEAREREALLMRYIVQYHPIFKGYDIIDTPNHPNYTLLNREERKTFTVHIEGGDVMMVAPNHVLIGCSERTTVYACEQLINILFERKIIEKATVISIPKRRDYMHLDTVMTQLKRNVWVMLGSLGKNAAAPKGRLYETEHQRAAIKQFHIDSPFTAKQFDFLEDLLEDISQNDLKASKKNKNHLFGG